MRNIYLLVILSLAFSFSITAFNASEKVFYQTSGYAVVWYFSGQTVPSMVPVGYSGQSVYISDVSPAQQNDVFIVQFKPFNATTGVFSASKPFITVDTFKLNNQSSYAIPGSVFQNAGQYRIVDTQWINPMNITSILLFNSTIFPTGGSVSNLGSGSSEFTLVWIVLLIILVLILALFVLLFRINKKLSSRRRR